MPMHVPLPNGVNGKSSNSLTPNAVSMMIASIPGMTSVRSNDCMLSISPPIEPVVSTLKWMSALRMFVSNVSVCADSPPGSSVGRMKKNSGIRLSGSHR